MCGARVKGPRSQGTVFRGSRTGGLANGKETAAGTPAIVPPTEVEVPPRPAPVEVQRVAVAVDLRNRSESDNGAFFIPPVPQQKLVGIGWLIALRLHPFYCFFG